MEHSMQPQVPTVPSSVDQETRRLILTRAAELFLAKGYKGVSMKEIADSVQVTSAALYYHFPKGKEELFTKMVQTVYVDEGVVGIDQRLAAARDFRERLTILTASLITLPLDERLTMLMRDAREYISDPQHQQVILSLLDRLRQQITGLLLDARTAGELRPDVPIEVLVSLYMSMVRQAKNLPAQDAAAWLVSVLLDGVAKREE